MKKCMVFAFVGLFTFTQKSIYANPFKKLIHHPITTLQNGIWKTESKDSVRFSTIQIEIRHLRSGSYTITNVINGKVLELKKRPESFNNFRNQYYGANLFDHA